MKRLFQFLFCLLFLWGVAMAHIVSRPVVEEQIRIQWIGEASMRPPARLAPSKYDDRRPVIRPVEKQRGPIVQPVAPVVYKEPMVIKPVVKPVTAVSQAKPLAVRPAVKKLAVKKLAKGLKYIPCRRNNPGNLKYAGQPLAKRTKSGFAHFPTPRVGWQALSRDLHYKISRRPHQTLQDLIHVWAPRSDGNNPRQYARFVAKKLKVTPRAKLYALRHRLSELAIAIAIFEGNLKTSRQS